MMCGALQWSCSKCWSPQLLAHRYTLLSSSLLLTLILALKAWQVKLPLPVALLQRPVVCPCVSEFLIDTDVGKNKCLVYKYCPLVLPLQSGFAVFSHAVVHKTVHASACSVLIVLLLKVCRCVGQNSRCGTTFMLEFVLSTCFDCVRCRLSQTMSSWGAWWGPTGSEESRAVSSSSRQIG